jgi:hypothetical protein
MKCCPSQAKLLDDSESDNTGSNDIDTEEEILWKPRAMYTGSGFVVATPESTMLPMPTMFLVRLHSYTPQALTGPRLLVSSVGKTKL